ncbi:MAG: hypothetical protein ACRDZU_06600, partial [Acidimicrobiales bacterium]
AVPPPPTTTPTAPPAPPVPPAQRAWAAYDASVPAAWRGAITVSIELIGGSTSWGWQSGLIQVSAAHARDDDELRATLAHEFGHLIAYRYGAQSTNGAAPVGWPSYSDQPVEAWADCVTQAFTGLDDPSHGLPSCPAASLAWTATWLAQGPAAHPRTD